MSAANCPNATGRASLNAVLAVVTELAEKSFGSNYIFRGEPKHYDKVSSSLYRQYQNVAGDGFDVNIVQQEILDHAKNYIGEGEQDDIETLTQLQHYGGKTNLIDFTTDYLIALFFACDGFPDEDGRVILLKRSGDHKIIQPRNPVNRVIAQKSIFVQSPRGYVSPDDTVVVPHLLKQEIFSYLRAGHGISPETIYNDLHGFIKMEATTHQSAYAELYTGGVYLHKEEYQQAIGHYNKSIGLNPGNAFAYFIRGFAPSPARRTQRGNSGFQHGHRLGSGRCFCLF